MKLALEKKMFTLVFVVCARFALVTHAATVEFAIQQVLKLHRKAVGNGWEKGAVFFTGGGQVWLGDCCLK